MASSPRSWPHAPSKVVTHPGTYIITAGTYRKEHLFKEPEDLRLLHDTLLSVAEEQGWQLQAWAVFSNHYHLVGFSPDGPSPVRAFTSKLHGLTAIELNRRHLASGRQVWYRSWDTRLTFEKSYLARLAYVHNNPVKHGLVLEASAYPWCSASWFFLKGDQPFYETVMAMDTSRVNVFDEF